MRRKLEIVQDKHEQDSKFWFLKKSKKETKKEDKKQDSEKNESEVIKQESNEGKADA